MTALQDKIAKDVIELHTKNDGYFDWTVFFYEQSSSYFPSDFNSTKKYREIEFIKSSLVKMGLIEIINETGDKSILLDQESDFSKNDFIQSVTTTPSRKQRKAKIKTVFKGICKDIIFPIIAALIAALIIYLVSKYFI